MKTFEELLDVVDAKFYKSFVNSSVDNTKPTFFYHIKKTGGMSLYYSTCLPASSLNQTLIPSEYTRILKCDTAEGLEELSKVPISGKSLILSHLPYGSHNNICTDFHLATILRAPYKRVLSHYTYNCMREQVNPNVEEFKKFYRDENMVNVMAKQLGSNVVDLTSEGAAINVYQHLQQNFQYFGVMEHIDTFIEYYLNSFQLPNVLMEPTNVTLPEYKLDGSECYDEIISLNNIDQELYKLVKDKPRIPDKLTGINVSNYTCLVHEREKEIRSSCAGTCIKTENLFIKLSELSTQNQNRKLLMPELLK